MTEREYIMTKDMVALDIAIRVLTRVIDRGGLSEPLKALDEKREALAKSITLTEGD